MNFQFRMKTGFYETRIYDLLISKGNLVFSPQESDDPPITIPEEIVLNISLKKNEKSFEMGIQTYEKTYQGLLVNNMDCELLLEELKENISRNILCEYER